MPIRIGSYKTLSFLDTLVEFINEEMQFLICDRLRFILVKYNQFHHNRMLCYLFHRRKILPFKDTDFLLRKTYQLNTNRIRPAFLSFFSTLLSSTFSCEAGNSGFFNV